MSVRLVCEDGKQQHEITVDDNPVVIGRGENATVQIDDRWLSRRHCEFEALNGTLVIRDLGSKHGTFVNNVQIDQFHLNPGDVISIGLNKFRVEGIPVSSDAISACSPCEPTANSLYS